MRKFINIFRLLCCSALLVQFTSCDLLDFDVDSDLSKVAAAMALNYDTIYVTPGTFIALKPTFDPDSLNTKDYLVWSSDTNVVSVNRLTGRIKAEAPGWARLFVETVSSQLRDSCTVNVIPVWEPVEAEFPYETVFYADVTVKGRPIGEHMIVAAFVGGELRAVGQALTFHDIHFIQMRVGADDIYGNVQKVAPQEEEQSEEQDEEEQGEEFYDELFEEDQEADAEEPAPLPTEPQDITFRCYDPILLRLYEYTLPAGFDGNTHGTLSKLYKIEFK